VLLVAAPAALADGAAPPKLIFAHYMGCFPVGYGPVAFHRTQAATMRHDSTDELMSMGGNIRNWPLMPDGAAALSSKESADLEIRRAMRLGIDGFAIDAWAGGDFARKTFSTLLAVAEEKNYPFYVTICLDPTCQAVKPVRDGYIESIKWVLDHHGSSPKLARRNGKLLIFGYQSQGILWGLYPKNQTENEAGWQAIIDEYKKVEAAVGQPIFFEYCMSNFFGGADFAKLPGARPPHQPGAAAVKASAAMAKYFGAVGAFTDSNMTPELPEMAKVVKAAGSEWAQPMWYQYENIRGSLEVGHGTDWLRDKWTQARASDSTLLQFVTWNDYGENTNLAPGYQTGYSLADLNRYYIQWWKTGKAPAPDHDRVYLNYRKYGKDAKPSFPFRSPRFADGVLESLTILTKPATIRLPGRGTYDAPAGFFVKQFPLAAGPVSAEVVRGGAVATRLDCPEPITDRPFRCDNAMVSYSTEEASNWKADFGDTKQLKYSEYGDADGDGLPNWFEMYWFGKFLDFSTATVADPNADPDGDGKTNLREYLAQSDPTKAPHLYKVGEAWDMSAIYARKTSFNPDPDFDGVPVWSYLYKAGNPGVAHDGNYEICPLAGQSVPYAGSMAHLAPYNVEGFGNVHGWISRSWYVTPDEKQKEDDAKAAGKKYTAAGHWRLIMRPRYQSLMVLAWDSPITGKVRFNADVVPVDGKDGITVTVERSKPQTELLRRVLQPGQGGPLTIPEIAVQKGDRLYIVADMLPGADLSSLVFDNLSFTITALEGDSTPAK
jgi:hypothetical protein